MKPLKSGDPHMAGDIALRGRLGEGGMGTVYFGVTPDGARVAVKTIRQRPDRERRGERPVRPGDHRPRHGRRTEDRGLAHGVRAGRGAAVVRHRVRPGPHPVGVRHRTRPAPHHDGRRARRHARRRTERHPHGGPAAPRSQARQRDPRRRRPAGDRLRPRRPHRRRGRHHAHLRDAGHPRVHGTRAGQVTQGPHRRRRRLRAGRRAHVRDDRPLPLRAAHRPRAAARHRRPRHRP